MKLYTIVLHLGSNKGESSKHLVKALELLSFHVCSIVKTSSDYVTAAWGNEDQADFINKAVIGQTHLSYDELLEKTKWIENKIGREKTEHWGARTIDIDIIYYDQIIYNSVNLNIPHPYMHQRNFVLEPLIEICPKYLHPIYQKIPRELLDLCTDDKSVKST